jgi:hypothetical protein
MDVRFSACHFLTWVTASPVWSMVTFSSLMGDIAFVPLSLFSSKPLLTNLAGSPLQVRVTYSTSSDNKAITFSICVSIK